MTSHTISKTIWTVQDINLQIYLSYTEILLDYQVHPFQTNFTYNYFQCFHILWPQLREWQAPEECYHQVPLNTVIYNTVICNSVSHIPHTFGKTTRLLFCCFGFFLIRLLLFTFPALLVARQTILLCSRTTKCRGYNCYNFRILICWYCKGKVVQWGSHCTGLLHTLLTLKHLKRHFPLLFQHFTSIYIQLLC